MDELSRRAEGGLSQKSMGVKGHRPGKRIRVILPTSSPTQITGKGEQWPQD